MNPTPDRPELDELLRKAAGHKMTPGELYDQRVSFVFGQLMKSNITREQVEKNSTVLRYRHGLTC